MRKPRFSGKLGAIQKIGTAYGAITGQSSLAISKEIGVAPGTITNNAKDEQVLGLINRLIAEYEPQLRMAFEAMLISIQRDLMSDKPDRVSSARRDLIKILGYSNSNPEHRPLVQAVLHMPAAVLSGGIEVYQVDKR